MRAVPPETPAADEAPTLGFRVRRHRCTTLGDYSMYNGRHLERAGRKRVSTSWQKGRLPNEERL